jgi:hypothetical protein
LVCARNKLVLLLVFRHAGAACQLHRAAAQAPQVGHAGQHDLLDYNPLLLLLLLLSALQVPLVSFTEQLRKRLKSDTLGNMIFWTSFCLLGQPMCLILYYHDYVLAHMGVQGLAKAAAAGAGAAASAAMESLAGEGVGGTLAAAAR